MAENLGQLQQFNFYKLLEESLETVSPNTEFILLGDFNTDLSNKNMTCSLVKELYNFSNMLGLSQLIDCAIAETDIPKRAITTPFGLWEFLRMPFGLRNAGQTFQRMIDQVLLDLPFVFTYLDDILVASYSPENHMHHLKDVFKRLSENTSPSRAVHHAKQRWMPYKVFPLQQTPSNYNNF